MTQLITKISSKMLHKSTIIKGGKCKNEIYNLLWSTLEILPDPYAHYLLGTKGSFFITIHTCVF